MISDRWCYSYTNLQIHVDRSVSLAESIEGLGFNCCCCFFILLCCFVLSCLKNDTIVFNIYIFNTSEICPKHCVVHFPLLHLQVEARVSFKSLYAYQRYSWNNTYMPHILLLQEDLKLEIEVLCMTY